MNGSEFDLLSFIRPPEDATPKQLKRWRWNVALSLLAGFLFCCWSLSPWGYAKASEVDDKISTLRGEMAAQSAITNKLAGQVTTALGEWKATEIRSVASKLCRESMLAERDKLNIEIDRKQEEYKNLKGERYQIPGCDRL